MITLLFTTMLAAPPAPPASPAPPVPPTAAAAASDMFVVTADATPVRCGPSTDHYAFVMADIGVPVRVTETVSGMARVAAEGPLFDNAWGIIRYPADGASPFDADGVVTRNNLEVYAPNVNNPGWSDSYGWVCALPSGTKVDVVDTSTANANTTGSTPFVVHIVRLPKFASGWIDAASLKPATGADIAIFTRGWADPPAWMHQTPSSPIADWNAWSQVRPEWLASNEVPEEPVEVVVVEETVVEVAPPIYRNTQWEALEKMIVGAALSKLDTATVAQLRAGYIDVIDQEAVAHPDLAERATFRLQQLELAASINTTRSDIAAAQTRILRSKQDLAAQRQLLDDSPNYIMRGKLSVSPVFNGVDRPVMYRLQDPFSGRSLAYLSPESDVDIRGMLGQRV
ncbi:MAG: hypothetical protein QF471_07190, partial [Phycisphaerales bacterium]|nr:hypothetical protein [Phycisphaerales bacterium]